jgi:hypothetical protein
MRGITHWIALLVAAGLALVATTAVVIPGQGAEPARQAGFGDRDQRMTSCEPSAAGTTTLDERARHRTGRPAPLMASSPHARVKLSREIAARTKPRFIEIKPEPRTGARMIGCLSRFGENVVEEKFTSPSSSLLPCAAG